MKKIALLLSLGVFLTVSCANKEQEVQVSNVSFTPCQQAKSTKSEISDKVDVEFTKEGVKITYCNFGVTCDFTIVNVIHTVVNGVLNITQQCSPNQANCKCYTDVSYTITGISQNDINVIFVNGEQVYCHNDDQKPYGGQGVYAVTYEFPDDGGWAEAKLWKNGTTQPISGINYVTSVYVTDNDVYVSGFRVWQAMLWKNGVSQTLSPFESFANSVYIYGDDVYVVGSEYRLKTAEEYPDPPRIVQQRAGSSHFKLYLHQRYHLNENAESTTKSDSDETQYNGIIAKLWKNGVGQDLSDGTYETVASSVYISGADVFVAGGEYKGQDPEQAMPPAVAKLWKNGEVHDLTDGRYYAWANSVYVSGDDVYVVGHENNASGRSVAKLWKNGKMHNLTNGTRDGWATSVFVSGNDVYVTGYERNAHNYDVAKLWKNGVGQNLTNENGIEISAEAQSVYVSGSDVYVVGSVWSAQSNYHNVAKLWKNGVAQDLTDGKKHGNAYSVFVK